MSPDLDYKLVIMNDNIKGQKKNNDLYIIWH